VSGSLVAANAENGISVRGAFAPVKLTKNVVVGNEMDGIGSVTNGTGLTIASNLAGGNGQHGIHIGPSATNAVTKNALLGNGSDGLLVEATAASNQVTANVATGNGNRGVAVSTPASTVAKNTARANLAIGITAAPGTIDGGGNAARDNAGVAQCTNIACN
jgi:parallel beta-helix repeat protein